MSDPALLARLNAAITALQEVRDDMQKRHDQTLADIAATPTSATPFARLLLHHKGFSILKRSI